MTIEFSVDRGNNTFRFYDPKGIFSVEMNLIQAEDFANRILDAIKNINITKGD